MAEISADLNIFPKSGGKAGPKQKENKLDLIAVGDAREVEGFISFWAKHIVWGGLKRCYQPAEQERMITSAIHEAIIRGDENPASDLGLFS